MKALDYPTLTPSHVAGSALAALHRSTDTAVTDVLAKDRSYVARRGALVTLGDYGLPPIPQVKLLDQTIADAILAAIAAGDPIPDDVATSVQDGEQIARRHSSHVQGVHIAQRTLLVDLDAALKRHTNALHESVTTALVDVVDEAAGVYKNGPRPTSADEAISARAIDAYIAGSQLEERYAYLRRTVQYAMQAALNAGPDHLTGDNAALVPYFLSNPLEAMPGFVTAEKDVRFLGGQQLPSGPWPADWFDASALWWFVDNPTARPWVPTTDQVAVVLQDVGEARHPRRDPADAARIERQRREGHSSRGVR